MGTMLDLELSTLSILNQDGDTRIQWDRSDPQQVAAAQARFDEFRGKRYLAYKVNASGTQGEVIDKFDPNAERIILHAPMVAG